MFKEGRDKTGGRKKGTSNKSTEQARQFFFDLMNGELYNIQESLTKVREESHAQYLALLAKYFPYYQPKQMDITSGGEKVEGFIVKSVRDADRDNAK